MQAIHSPRSSEIIANSLAAALPHVPATSELHIEPPTPEPIINEPSDTFPSSKLHTDGNPAGSDRRRTSITSEHLPISPPQATTKVSLTPAVSSRPASVFSDATEGTISSTRAEAGSSRTASRLSLLSQPPATSPEPATSDHHHHHRHSGASTTSETSDNDLTHSEDETGIGNELPRRSLRKPANPRPDPLRLYHINQQINAIDRTLAAIESMGKPKEAQEVVAIWSELREMRVREGERIRAEAEEAGVEMDTQGVYVQEDHATGVGVKSFKGLRGIARPGKTPIEGTEEGGKDGKEGKEGRGKEGRKAGEGEETGRRCSKEFLTDIVEGI